MSARLSLCLLIDYVDKSKVIASFAVDLDHSQILWDGQDPFFPTTDSDLDKIRGRTPAETKAKLRIFSGHKNAQKKLRVFARMTVAHKLGLQDPRGSFTNTLDELRFPKRSNKALLYLGGFDLSGKHGRIPELFEGVDRGLNAIVLPPENVEITIRAARDPVARPANEEDLNLIVEQIQLEDGEPRKVSAPIDTIGQDHLNDSEDKNFTEPAAKSISPNAVTKIIVAAILLTICALSIRQLLDRSGQYLPLEVPRTRQPESTDVQVGNSRNRDPQDSAFLGASDHTLVVHFDVFIQRSDSVLRPIDSVSLPVSPRDSIRFDVDSQKPVCFYLLWMDPKGKVSVVWPQMTDETSITAEASTEKHMKWGFPADPLKSIPLKADTEGIHSIVLAASTTTLPDISILKAELNDSGYVGRGDAHPPSDLFVRTSDGEVTRRSVRDPLDRGAKQRTASVQIESLVQVIRLKLMRRFDAIRTVSFSFEN
ncbi:MAG: hypothetical protein R3C59_09470 [Planctomycetaceae bacterium]